MIRTLDISNDYHKDLTCVIKTKQWQYLTIELNGILISKQDVVFLLYMKFSMMITGKSPSLLILWVYIWYGIKEQSTPR